MNEQSRIYSVNELNQEARDNLESKFSNISVEGEVSRSILANSGHIYFNLKDEHAQIACAFFRSSAYRSKHKPKDGEKIIATGNLSIYPQRGNYQLIVRMVELAGTGNLWMKFGELQERLRKLGYFDEARKTPVPQCPKRVGIITSPDGAAVQDIIRAFSRRFPSIELIVYPTLVQGDLAAKQIAKMVHIANERKEVDAIIMSRGGGSIEDLWPFNEEVVAEAIKNSKLPVVTGVGHQTDTTIADLVADARAATPTAAAELLSTPAMGDVIRQLQTAEHRLDSAVSNRLGNLGQRVDYAEKGLVHPKQKIANLDARFEHAAQSLTSRILEQLRTNADQCRALHQALGAASPVKPIDSRRMVTENFQNVIQLQAANRLKEFRAGLSSLQSRIESTNPDATLKRGYAIVRSKSDDRILRNTESVAKGHKITAQLHSGVLHCDVEKVADR